MNRLMLIAVAVLLVTGAADAGPKKKSAKPLTAGQICAEKARTMHCPAGRQGACWVEQEPPLHPYVECSCTCARPG